ncbi:MAG: thioredoxin family protein [Bacteroidales bacterium]|nr:thioredoxin family protein [Bacteroidales bacterium]
MKKTVIIALLAMLCIPTGKAQVKWNSMEQSAKVATANNGKLFFVDFYTTWCGWCKKMDKDTFTDKVVAKIMNKYFIPTKFDAEGDASFTWNGVEYKGGGVAANGRRATHPFAQAILGARMGFPSFAIFGPDRKLLTVIPGYNSAADFTVILWYFASGDYEKYAFEKYTAIFDTQIRPTMEKALGL